MPQEVEGARPVRLYVTVKGWYEIPPEAVQGSYRTTDPVEMARIDQANLDASRFDVHEVLSWLDEESVEAVITHEQPPAGVL